MTRPLLVLALLLPTAVAAQQSPKPETVSFTHRAPYAGDVQRQKFEVQADLEFDGTKFQVHQALHRTLTVLEVAPNGMLGKYRVHYTKSKLDSKGMAAWNPFAGLRNQSYLIQVQDSSITVKGSQGELVPEPERGYVAMQEEDMFLGVGEAVTRILRGGPLKKGAQLDFSNELAPRLLDIGPAQIKFTKRVLTFKGTRKFQGKTYGLFELAVRGEHDDGALVAEAKLRGPVLVELASSRVRRSELSGTIKFTFGGGPETKGTVKVFQDSTYTEAKRPPAPKKKKKKRFF